MIIIIGATSNTVHQKLENRIDELEKEKLLLEDKLEKTRHRVKHYDGMYRASINFLMNSHKYWTYGGFTALKLVFADRLIWDRNGLY